MQKLIRAQRAELIRAAKNKRKTLGILKRNKNKRNTNISCQKRKGTMYVQRSLCEVNHIQLSYRIWFVRSAHHKDTHFQSTHNIHERRIE